jgi:hypothetical protein
MQRELVPSETLAQYILANLSAHRKARNGAAVAPTGLARVLVAAFSPPREPRPPPICAGAAVGFFKTS